MGALAGAAVALLAVTAPSAGAQERPEPELPTDLWKTYPLEPEQGTTGEPSSGGGVTTTEAPRPAPAAPAQPKSSQNDSGGSLALVLVIAALDGLAVLLAIGFVFARRRGRLPALRLPRRQAAVLRDSLFVVRAFPALAVVPARRLTSAVGSVRLPQVRMPQVRMPQVLRSEAGSLHPLANPSARRERLQVSGPKPASRPEKPPPKKSLPGLAPPPAKEKQLRSGLPPGKTVPVSAPGSKVAPPDAKPRPVERRKRPVEPRGPLPRAAAPTAEECEIEWWRGYAKSDFYAFVQRTDGSIRIVARSPSFRWRSSDPPPPEGRAQEAYAVLLELLRAWGWESMGGADSVWYRTRLHRRLGPTLRDLAG